MEKRVVGVRDLHHREVVQERLELGEVGGRGQESRGGGGSSRVIHKIEVAADEGGETPSDSRHGIHKLALDDVLVDPSVEIAVEDQKRLMRSVDGGVLPALDIATALWESNVRSRVVLEDAGSVHNKSARYITCAIVI